MLNHLSYNTNNCPGSELIVDLLRAEHEQVKQRTDIIKQLIAYNCGSVSDKRFIEPRSFKHSFMNDCLTPNIQFNNAYDEISDNIQLSRHANCFKPFTGKHSCPSDNFQRFKPIRENRPIKTIEEKQSTQTLLTRSSKSPVICGDNKKKLPTYSQVISRELPIKKSLPTYSLEVVGGGKKPVGRTASPLLRKETGSYESSNKKKIFTKNSKTSQTENSNVKSDKQCQEKIKQLQNEINQLKNMACLYEEEKADWICEKRKQIKILQLLRDASCEETKAAMKLTSWKTSDIDCQPEEYERIKNWWLKCKKQQIELLEQLRAVSLNEIQKSLEKISSTKQVQSDSNDLYEISTNLVDGVFQELFSNDNIAINIGRQSSRNNQSDSDKLNINIMMKQKQNEKLQKNNMKKLSPRQRNINNQINQASVINHQSNLTKSLPNLQNINEEYFAAQEKMLITMREHIESQIGTQLFKNTYEMIKKLQCPEMILSTKDEREYEILASVYKYVQAENMLYNNTILVKDEDINCC